MPHVPNHVVQSPTVWTLGGNVVHSLFAIAGVPTQACELVLRKRVLYSAMKGVHPLRLGGQSVGTVFTLTECIAKCHRISPCHTRGEIMPNVLRISNAPACNLHVLSLCDTNARHVKCVVDSIRREVTQVEFAYRCGAADECGTGGDPHHGHSQRIYKNCS